ncbi:MULTISPECIES: type IVB secretion system protein IcmX [unclassified Legionella]|uniref:type IVB secretion system protein IcmX n=1 Tax=unclassified Legionella TaxID=2622702 RepID=UPI001055E5C8|nr:MULTISPECIES: type IVB secretion system protein IcmX [unclassified Legionella]MDI9818675.1 type IVB secretion system protein IcmX [Legionella sp. PL877]
MKSFGRRLALSGLLLSMTSSFASQGGYPNNQHDPWDNSLSQLTTYILNLGQYLGYNLRVDPSAPAEGRTVSENLVPSTTQAVQGVMLALFDSVFGALPVTTAAQITTQFVPNTVQAYTSINAFANSTFNSSAYSSPSASQISISPLIDQPTYQEDPVSQSVLNILATPDYSYCLNNDGTALATCTYPSGVKNESQVMQNVVGINRIPDTQTYFTYNYNQPFISQLNTNSLISPLMYTTETTTVTTSSPTPAIGGAGLTAQNQAQQAANFIRYATGIVAPMALPNRQEYDALFVKALNSDGSYTRLEQFRAQSILASYLTNLRIYAAQSSVGISNLYYILSKRMPQPIPGGTPDQASTTSQALSEFTMATWRLYNPDRTQNTQWLSQINQASAATMQKEIAVLLAEINYQLYLNRQQQERLLLTNTMLLIQNVRNSQPDTLTTQASTATGQ